MADVIDAVKDDLADALKRMSPNDHAKVKEAMDSLEDAADKLCDDPEHAQKLTKDDSDKIKDLIDQDDEPKVVKDKNSKNPKGKVKAVLIPANEDAGRTWT